MMAGPNPNCLLMKDTLYISMVSSDSCSFDRLYPTKTIHEWVATATLEDGLFVQELLDFLELISGGICYVNARGL